MPSVDRIKADSELRAAAEAAIEGRRPRRFRVVLEGIRTEYETAGSFAIKFGLAISEPVTKIQHMMRSLPAVVWKGESASTAAGLLAMVEEAGGRARIEEIAVETERAASAGPGISSEPEGNKASSPDRDRSSGCPACGFPVRGEEKYCQFCLSPLEGRPARKASVSTAVRARGKRSIPPARLLIYALIALAAVFIHLIAG